MLFVYKHQKSSHHLPAVLLMILIALSLVTACKSNATEVDATPTVMPEDMSESGHDDDMSEMNEDHDHDSALREFTPNNGAAVIITAPADQASFKVGDPVPVTIQTTDFTIGENGNHWHVYLDGNATMVMGGTTYVLTDLSVGHHEIEVFLSNGDHQDLEQGDKVTIMVEE